MKEESYRDKYSLYSVILSALARENIGKKEYGKDSYKSLNLYSEIEEELLDVIVYSYLEILKVRELASIKGTDPIVRSYEDIEVLLLESPNEKSKNIVGSALGITMKAKNFMLKEANSKTIKDVLIMGHTSIFEHLNYRFSILGASRSFLAQITRHRMGSFTSGSQHYQNYGGYGCTVSKKVINNKLLLGALSYSMAVYKKLIKDGVSKEEARQVLPNAMQNNLLWTVNARSLINFLNLRLCDRNVEEMCIVANKIKDLLILDFPELFKYVGPDCFMYGACRQGRLSCGKNRSK